jgi:hypothetical protein
VHLQAGYQLDAVPGGKEKRNCRLHQPLGLMQRTLIMSLLGATIVGIFALGVASLMQDAEQPGQSMSGAARG